MSAPETEQDIDYLHVFSQPENHNGYYHIWAHHEDGKEFNERFRPTADDDLSAPAYSGYRLYKSLPLPVGVDYRKFRDYVRDVLQETEQMKMHWGVGYKVDIETLPQQLIDSYPAWKQEKERVMREHYINEYQKKSKGQFELF